MELNEPLLQHFRDVTCGKGLSSPPKKKLLGLKLKGTAHVRGAIGAK
jgi:hypothetical protein